MPNHVWQNENDYKHDFCTALRAYGVQVQEHEDRYANFIPDLSFANAGVEGWIEVKYKDEEPYSLDAIKHWTRGQEDWLIRRGQRGTGWCFLLVGTPRIHVLFRFGCLSAIRCIKWQSALGQAWDKDYDYALLAERFARRARRRAEASVSGGSGVGAG